MPNPTGFDIIGDVHGHATALHELLHHLGYRLKRDIWCHPETRRAVFVGDFVHGGDQGFEVLRTIRDMVAAGSAEAILGNHEANLLHHYLTDEGGQPLRSLNDRQWQLHAATLRQRCESHPDEWEIWLRWLQSLPLWLDHGDFRVIHACWHEPSLRKLPDNRLHGSLLQATAKDGPERAALEIILKGPTLPALQGLGERPVRLHWWRPVNGMICLPEVLLSDLATGNFTSFLQPDDHSYEYPADQPLLFIGHYNHLGTSEASILADNIVCVDHGVKSGGSLVAYRWNRGEEVGPSQFCRVP
jgi:hypothetical protein